VPFLHVRRSMAFNNLHFSPNIVKIVFIVGTKNSGKTTAAEYIVGELARLGYKVGTVKHIHHEFTIDTEGKDTYRMRKAGASMVVSISPSEVAVMRRPEDEDNEFKKVAQQMSSEGFDFLVVEGFKMLSGGIHQGFKILTCKTKEELDELLTELPQIDAISGIVSEKLSRVEYQGVPLVAIPRDGGRLIDMLLSGR